MLYQLSYHGGYPSSILYGIYVHLYMEESVSAACYHYGECGTPFFCLLAITLRLQLRYDYFQYPYTSLAALCICQFSENLLVTGGGNSSPSHLNACTWTHAQLIKKKKTSHTPLRLLRFTVSDSWVKERTINLRVCCLCWTHYNEN